jgi:O-antigen/teichoic acid export membrane protein
MFIGVVLFNLFNLLYHLFMVRLLTPIDYGHLNTLMALFMVISVPASTVQTTVTKFVSSFQVQNRYDQMKKLLGHLLILMLIVAFFIFLLVALGSAFISSFLQISSYGLVILLGAMLVFAMVIPIPWGGLQGLQKFGSLTFNLIINGGLKFSLGILFVFLGLGVLGAMGAIAISYVVTIFLSLLMLEIYLSKKTEVVHREHNLEEPEPPFIAGVYQYFLPVGITLLCFMILTNVDLILVKHFFTPIEAGYYSIAQITGKFILFLPIPVVLVMFPKLSALEGQEKKALSILGQSLTMACLFCMVATALCFLFPSFIIHVLSGEVYSECIPLVGFFALNMTLFSISIILLYYQLSTEDRSFLYPLCCLTLLQTGLILFFHKTLIQVLLSVGIIALLLIGVNLFLIYIYPRRNKL